MDCGRNRMAGEPRMETLQARGRKAVALLLLAALGLLQGCVERRYTDSELNHRERSSLSTAKRSARRRLQRALSIMETGKSP